MKPISLSIKGLNSFEEEQHIDFLKLTQNGFFGIFGPTGSGKSTILDGICLALYGDIPRGKVNFINLNSDRAYVEFEFQISGAENRKYRVSREFRRDKKSGSLRSDKCKLVDVTYDEPEILEESVTAITKKCEAIIGLKKDDFLRTVVLPQGKFSEFLKLDGKDRRNMLERLFNLYEYGDELRKKLSNSMDIEKSKLTRLEGELSGIGAVEPDDLQNQEILVKAKKDEYELASKEAELILEKLNKQTEVFKLQNEKKTYVSQLDEALAKKPEIENKAKSLAIFKNANQLKDMIADFEKTKLEFESCNKKLSEIELKRKDCAEKKTEIEAKYDMAKQAYETELPNLLASRGKYIEALEKIKELDILKLKIDECKAQEIELNKKLKKLNTDKEYKSKDLERFKKDIEEITSVITQLKVSALFRSKVEAGYQLSKDIAKEAERKLKLELEKSNISKECEENNKEVEAINSKLKDLKAKDLLIQKEMDALKEMPLGNRDDLIKLNESFNLVSQAWKLNEEKSRRIEEANHKANQLRNQVQELNKARAEQKFILEEECKKLEKSKIENLALELRKSLSHGESCPVCGAVEHPYLHDEAHNLEPYSENLAIYESKIEEATKLVTNYDEKINKLDTELAILTKQIEEDYSEIAGIDKSLLAVSSSDIKLEYEALDTRIKDFEMKKQELEINEKACLKEISSYENKNASITSKLEASSRRLEILEKDMAELFESLNSSQDNLSKLKEDLKVENFELEYKKIIEMESKREAYEKDLTEKNKHCSMTEDLLKDIEKEINLSSNDLSNVSTRKDSWESSYNEQKSSLISKVGELDSVAGVLKDTESKITEVQSNYKEQSKLKTEAENEYSSLNEEFIKENQKLIGLDLRIKDTDKNLNIRLTELGFGDIEAVKLNFKDQIELDAIEKEIKDYENKMSNLSSIIQTLDSKLAGRGVDEEEFKMLEIEAKEKQIALSDLNKSLILESKKLDELKLKLESIKEILEKKNKIEKKQAILKELETLFKGNRFVEFVATERLKYVSREASKRLLDITGGGYSLETDDDGIFLIRDNKNGGVLRDTSTLSGGETFLASLALALSLSAEIQLKGTAPLELFFLDEGFGTLDDNLLEVLMSSLEKIHNDKLKIGLISHVESVKQRVPVKLIVTPAKSGICGSTIKIEHN
ncbi:SbcC/MukB-like Walker B domain-containing protein [Acetoanaerobium noterae]|uniref:SbcC/MukB-like Walker B domain-containing protein n=1 Tax=Acetoanaerobium noterae TaxID=745369 RepID=UPI0028AA6FA5|nr:SbcC/MukB-like Walker B domain-containing protein [Acetoanaerobium noterae]